MRKPSSDLAPAQQSTPGACGPDQARDPLGAGRPARPQAPGVDSGAPLPEQSYGEPCLCPICAPKPGQTGSVPPPGGGEAIAERRSGAPEGPTGREALPRDERVHLAWIVQGGRELRRTQDIRECTCADCLAKFAEDIGYKC